jgi:hypothetical protein
MKNFLKDFYRFIPLFLVILYSPALAHQPRITEQAVTNIIDPEISKAYYAQLSGYPQTYTIVVTGAFNLYVSILVPAIQGQLKDVTATVFKDRDYAHPISVLGGSHAEWKYFFEPFGYDAYWQ